VKDVKPELVRYACLYEPDVENSMTAIDRLKKEIKEEEEKPGYEAYKLTYDSMPQEESSLEDKPWSDLKPD